MPFEATDFLKVEKADGSKAKLSREALRDELTAWSAFHYVPTSAANDAADGQTLVMGSQVHALGDGVTESAGDFFLSEGRVIMRAVQSFEAGASGSVNYRFHDNGVPIGTAGVITPLTGTEIAMPGQSAFEAVAMIDVPIDGAQISLRVVSGGGAGVNTVVSGSYVSFYRIAGLIQQPTGNLGSVATAGLPAAVVNNGAVRVTTDNGLAYCDGVNWRRSNDGVIIG